MSKPPGRLAVIVKGYPRLSETFIAQEILGLQQRGIKQLIVSLRHPYDDAIHGMHRAIKADVLYLPEYLKDDPPRLRRTRRAAAALPGFAEARRAFEADLAVETTANRRRRWGQACVLATELPADIGWIHTHYLHTPASVARYAALLLGRGWSFSAHAKDIWTSPEWDLREKLREAAWGVTCTQTNLDYLRGLSAEPDRVSLVYHGLDIEALDLPPETEARLPHGGPLRIVTVGRAVEKKGFDDLLKALALLPKDLAWHFTHIGKGESLEALQALAARLKIADAIDWLGAQPRDRVFETYRQSDLFVLPSKVARSGDRDGLPNVLMEAQLCGLACISTAVSAIPELIENEQTGLLVAPDDPQALAKAIERLMREGGTRARLAKAGAERVRTRFSCNPGIDALAERFRPLLAGAPC